MGSSGNKRKRLRKSRTNDISDSSDSDSDVDLSSKEDKQNKNVKKINNGISDIPHREDDMIVDTNEQDKLENTVTDNEIATNNINSNDLKEVSGIESIPEWLNMNPGTQSAQDIFEKKYLEIMTSSFENDLLSLRKSKDFNDKSLPLLVEALKQGKNIFSLDEKNELMQE